MPTIELRRKVAAAVLCLAAATPAHAHHSFAMFDRSKTLILKGAVKDFQWTNPHAWIQLQTAAEGDGGGKEWSIEMGRLDHDAGEGWQREYTIKPVDKVLAAPIAVHCRDGAAGGTPRRSSSPSTTVVCFGSKAGKVRPLSEIKPN